jgi:hypothetical protein
MTTAPLDRMVRWLGLPTGCATLPIIRSLGSMSFFLGIRKSPKSQPLPPDSHTSQPCPDAYLTSATSGPSPAQGRRSLYSSTRRTARASIRGRILRTSEASFPPMAIPASTSYSPAGEYFSVEGLIFPRQPRPSQFFGTRPRTPAHFLSTRDFPLQRS